MSETVSYNQMSKEDLLNELKTAQEEYKKASFDHQSEGIQNPLQLRGMRRDVAKIKTALRQIELGSMSEKELARRSKIRARRRNR